MIQHTPGPWTTDEDADGEFWVRIPSHDLDICNIEGSCGECYANARLIAAAPDLLEACEKILKVVDEDETNSFNGYEWMFNDLRTIVKKAREG